LGLFISLSAADGKQAEFLKKELVDGHEIKLFKVDDKEFEVIEKNGNIGIKEEKIEPFKIPCVFYTDSTLDGTDLFFQEKSYVDASKEDTNLTHYIKNIKPAEKDPRIYAHINRTTPFSFVIEIIKNMKGQEISKYYHPNVMKANDTEYELSSKSTFDNSQHLIWNVLIPIRCE